MKRKMPDLESTGEEASKRGDERRESSKDHSMNLDWEERHSVDRSESNLFEESTKERKDG